MSAPRRCRRALVAGVVALAALITLADRAAAHAIVKETQPAADEVVATSPARVVMRFNEPVELAFGSIRVYDTDRRRVDEGRARHEGAEVIAVDLASDLADGTYTVTWRVVSADGHPIHEAFVFHVGAPGERPRGIAADVLGGQAGSGQLEGALAGAARWLLFTSLLVLVGAIGFALLVARGDAAWRRVAGWSWVGVLVGSGAAYVLQGSLAGDMPLGQALDVDVLREVAETRFGTVTFVRLGLLAALAALLWRRLLVPAAVVAVAVAATPGVAGHAGTTSPIALNVVADTIHVVAAGVWLGGVVLLVLALRRASDADVVGRFSNVAQIAIAAVVVTGVVRSWIEVRSLGALDEPYALVLLAKVAVFAPLVAAGFVNSRVLKPRLATDTASWTMLRRVVGAEVALAVVVIGLTALLVNMEPARVADADEGPFVTDVHIGDHHLNVIVDPAEVGQNIIHLTVTDDAGAPVTVEAMTVLFRLPEHDIGPLVALGVYLAPGHFSIEGRQLSVAGEWTLEIVARTGRFDEERTEVTLRIR